MTDLPSVCVIGAGVSGLTACKSLSDFGVPHTCFEASDEVGGNWYFQNPNGVSSAYRSLHIDISKPSISFRDFPMPDRYPDYPHHTHIFEWLRDYADAFALRERNRDGWKQLRKTALVLLSLVLMLTIAAFGAAIAASYLHRATDHLAIPVSVPTTSSYSNGVVVQPGSEGIAPTPVAPKYQIGAWMSNNAPGGGSVKVFVRLTEDVAPIPQIPVTLSVQMPGGSVVKLGPTNTDGYGLATFTVKFGGTRGVPIFVTASATVGDENLSADTVFVPA